MQMFAKIQKLLNNHLLFSLAFEFIISMLDFSRKFCEDSPSNSSTVFFFAEIIGRVLGVPLAELMDGWLQELL